MIRTEHGPLVWPDITKIEEFSMRQFVGRKNLGFVAISENQKSKIPDLNWVGVNYNGVDLSDFEYTEEKDNYLLYLGRVNKQKGVHNAIEAAKLAKMPLVIAGEVEETPDSLEYFETKIKPLIDDYDVYHLDKGVNAEERKKWLSKAKALLMLIEWDEPFGMVMAEALASGTPIVGYRKGSIPEIVKENTGYVVDSIDDAVDSINDICQGKTSPIECRKTAEKFFSAEAMASN